MEANERAVIGGNGMSREEFLRQVLYSGEVTKIAQHLALVLFLVSEGKNRIGITVREIEDITGWGKSTIRDHISELEVFMKVTLGTGRSKTFFELQGVIEDAIASAVVSGSRTQAPKQTAREPDKNVVQPQPDSIPDTKPDTTAVVSGSRTDSRTQDEVAPAPRARAYKESPTEILSNKKDNTPRVPKTPDEEHREAYLRGLEIKGGKTPKSARAAAAAKGELDGSRGITFADGKLTISDSVSARLSEDFPKVEMKAVCNKAAPEVARMRYPSADDAIAVLRKWAQIEAERLKTAGPAKHPNSYMQRH